MNDSTKMPTNNEDLGWIGDSSVLPREAKDIKMSSSMNTLMNLKAVLYEKQAQVSSDSVRPSGGVRLNGRKGKRRKIDRMFEGANVGVSERNERDLSAKQDAVHDAQRALQKKVKLYESLLSNGGGGGDHDGQQQQQLVDFEQKAWGDMGEYRVRSGSKILDTDGVSEEHDEQVRLDRVQSELRHKRRQWEERARAEIERHTTGEQQQEETTKILHETTVNTNEQREQFAQMSEKRKQRLEMRRQAAMEQLRRKLWRAQHQSHDHVS